MQVKIKIMRKLIKDDRNTLSRADKYFVLFTLNLAPIGFLLAVAKIDTQEYPPNNRLVLFPAH